MKALKITPMVTLLNPNSLLISGAVFARLTRSRYVMRYIRQMRKSTDQRTWEVRFSVKSPIDAPSPRIFRSERTALPAALSAHGCRLRRPLGRRSKAIQRGHDAALIMRYARKPQTHFDAGQGSGQHEVVKGAEVADTKSFTRELA